MRQNVLCLSRAYLSNLLPRLAQFDSEADYFHIVQTDAEARRVEAAGGKVVLNLEAVVRQEYYRTEPSAWREPADFRAVTGFGWSALYSDRHLPDLPATKRERVATIVFNAVAALFAERQYHAFVSEPVAIFVTHVIFYFCRKNGTRPLLWANTYFPDHFYFADAAEISQPTPIAGEPNTSEILQKTVHSYVHGVIGDRAGPAYHHAFATAPKARGDYLQQRKGERPLVLRPGLASVGLQAIRLLRAGWKRLLFPHRGDYMTAGSLSEHRAYMGYLLTPSYVYDALPESTSLRSVVYPLQYEPEASLLYFAPEVVSQHSFVETILKALPSDCLLWVKEHPNQFGALGEEKWRRLKDRYANLRFFHGRQSGRELIKLCGPVVTISSSMGMDGLLLGRKVIVAGQVFYRNFTGALPVSSHAEMAVLLNDSRIYEATDNSEANIAELTSFGRNSYLGDPQPSDMLFTDANLKALASAIRTERLAGTSVR